MYKILVADDEYEAREGLIAALGKCQEVGTVIGGARSGKEAMEKLITERPDILVTDIRMPGFSGIDVIRKARELNPETIVIVISGFADFHYAQSALRAGAFDYLLKPCTYQEVIAVLRRALKTTEASSSAEVAHSGRSIVKYMQEQIHEKYQSNVCLKDIAEQLEMNPDYLSTLFRNEMGVNFSEYLVKYRISRAMELLKELDLKVYEVAQSVGYKDYKYFARLFKEETGMTPLGFKKNSDGGRTS